MSETTPSYVTPGMAVLTPYLICDGAAAAIDFYVQVFEAKEVGERFVDADGRIGHAELEIGGAQLHLADLYDGFGMSPAGLPDSPVALGLYAPDVDAALARAEAAGGTIISPVEETFYGARRFRLRDPFGHRWIVATHAHDVTPEDYEKAVEGFAQTPSSDVS